MKIKIALSLFPIFLSLFACADDARWDAFAARNAETLYVTEHMDSLLAAEAALPTSIRAGLWARRFVESPDSRYLFGLTEGGYVAEGLVISDRVHDCVSLTYRISELARATDSDDALRIALETRFAGAPLDSLIDAEGRVDYDRPEHLDYSLDMIRSGYWGRDVTRSLTGAKPDGVGSSRYAADSFLYVGKSELVEGELREGDIAWMVLNPQNESARRLRKEYGLVIGHIGIIIVEDGRAWLVHAASSPLEGFYEGGRVVKVPLAEYLARVDRFAGVMVTRFD